MGIPHGLKDGSGGSRPKEEVSRQKENFNLLGLGLPSLNLVPRYAISKTKVLEGDTQREPDGRTNKQPRFSTRLPHQHDANANDQTSVVSTLWRVVLSRCVFRSR